MLKKKGFTLTELILVIVITGIMAGIMAPLIAVSISSWITVRKERSAISNGRYALERMAREIRQIKNVASITSYTTTRFTFTRVKYDGSEETVDYQKSGTSLLRNSDDLTNMLNSSTGLTFTYLDANLGTPATQNDIRMVRIDLLVTNDNVNIRMQTLARFRNT